jgi:2-oxoglutarate ferredoxin oxidoreductase subunit gamma
MHPQSLDTLAPKLRPNGWFFSNATLVPAPARADITTVPIPATGMAEQAGNIMGAGMIMLGAFVARTELVSLVNVISAMRAALPAHRSRMADMNAALLQRGADFIRDSAGTAARTAPQATP